MKKVILFSFLLLLFIGANAQDKIINTNNDTINCKIISISSERILYELRNTDGSVKGMFIPLSQVAEYLRSNQSKKDSKIPKPESPKSKYTKENPFCLSLNLGRSNIPWYFDNIESPSTMPDYYNKLKTGFHIRATGHYMINNLLGVGVEYSYLKTSTSGSMQFEPSESIYFMDFEKYRQYINYIGASVLLQQHLDAQRKFILSESLSAGVLFLRLEYLNSYPDISQSGYSEISQNTLLTGNSFSMKLGLSTEYRLYKSISIGLSGDFIWGSLKKASFESKGSNNYSSSSEDQKLSHAMKLSRFDYSFFSRYYF